MNTRPSDSRRISIAGVMVDNVTLSEAVLRVENLARAAGPSVVVTPNIDHVVKLHRDAEFRRIYEAADLVLADGMPLVWAARFLGTPLKERVTGSDLFPALCACAALSGLRVFFLGGREGAAEKASEILRAANPGLMVCGVYSPPLGFEKDTIENKKIERLLSEARPDILFVGLGAPKQEKWIWKHARAVGVPVSIGVGVSFEFVAGMVRRSPRWMQRSGLEWLWRLGSEPKRLWRRYLIEDPYFFWLVLEQKWRS